ncbi:kinase-like domain-containing protein [Sparassis latifolia]|uniref:non-specific serine/threonine protein kinase n=1 Tax=Sparassis crispa TaxID=139825 RepID=A0A401GZ39_9APHY|nr:hypothetical protein SCP_1101000 [Sparassis crispa]GBE87424.1 hypothetical protein SCP_1101000 [Sparassis crispa]
MRLPTLRFASTARFTRSLSTVSSAKATLLPSDELIEEERQDEYNPQAYYPVRLGEVLGGVYQVAFKLGYGRGATVWLARDTRRWWWQHDRYVAIKVTRNDRLFRAAALREMELLRHIATANPAHLGRQCVRTMLDSFEIEGPHGHHYCLVYEPLREPLWMMQLRTGGKYTPSTLKAILQAVLHGLDYLHSECHIIHTDLKPENILFGLEDISLLDRAVKDEAEHPSSRKVTTDRTIYLSRFDVGPPKTPPGPPKIADFDHSYRGDGQELLEDFIQVNQYRAPEVVMGIPWSYSVDIWNFGMMLWDLLQGDTLCVGAEKEYTREGHLAELIALLGPPPKDFLGRAKLAHCFFDDNGEFKYDHLVRDHRSLDESVTVLEGEEKALFLKFARGMLQWLPENRKTAKELLRDPWLHDFLRN